MVIDQRCLLSKNTGSIALADDKSNGCIWVSLSNITQRGKSKCSTPVDLRMTALGDTNCFYIRRGCVSAILEHDGEG